MDKTFCRAIVTDKKNPYKKRQCRNYARTGFTCCYSHRKIETPEYEKTVVRDFVQAAIDKVIYESRMDYIRKHGWDKYTDSLKKGKI
jgi:hypothetical protein